MVTLYRVLLKGFVQLHSEDAIKKPFTTISHFIKKYDLSF